jgi:hypothetical protein
LAAQGTGMAHIHSGAACDSSILMNARAILNRVNATLIAIRAMKEQNYPAPSNVVRT